MLSRFRTSIKIKPKGSHAVLLVFSLIVAGCLTVGFYFLWLGKYLESIPAFFFALLVFAVVVRLWLASHQNVDAPPSHPTSIVLEDGNKRTSIQADPHIIRSPEFLERLERVFSMVRHREQLPDPDGLIGEDGKPVPDSSLKAQERVESVNSEIKQIRDEILEQDDTVEEVEEKVQVQIHDITSDNTRKFVNETD